MQIRYETQNLQSSTSTCTQPSIPFRCISFKSQTQLVSQPVTVTPHTLYIVSKAKAKTVMPKHAKGNEEILEIIIKIG